jgi:hypothetical protein
VAHGTTSSLGVTLYRRSGRARSRTHGRRHSSSTATASATPRQPSAQLADHQAHLTLASDLECLLTQLHDQTQAANVEDRQRVLRLLVKDVLIGPEKITIRHRIPIRERTTTSEQHDSADTEGDQDVSCPVRWGRIHSSVSGGRSKVPVNCGPSTTPTSRATSGSETGSERINRDEATTTTASAPVATSRASMKLISTTGTHYPFPNAHHSRHYSIK